MTITIFGEPIAKQRARTFRKRGRIITWDPQHDKKLGIIKYLLSAKKRTDFIQDATYQVMVRFYMTIPKSFSNSKLAMLKWGFNSYEHPTLCDIDNLAKWILDCGNNLLWPDDRHVTALFCEKFYSTNPRTEIEIMEVPPQKIPKSITDILTIYSPEDVQDLISKVENISDMFKLFNHHNEDTAPGKAQDLVDSLIDLANSHADLLKKISKKSSTCDKNKL